jgi:hypothetical protein
MPSGVILCEESGLIQGEPRARHKVVGVEEVGEDVAAVLDHIVTRPTLLSEAGYELTDEQVNPMAVRTVGTSPAERERYFLGEGLTDE